MTREEQIREASIDYQLSTNPRAICGDAFADFAREMNVNQGFIAGAKWMEKQMIEKVYEWLGHVFKDLAGYKCSGALIEDFKKEMEE